MTCTECGYNLPYHDFNCSHKWEGMTKQEIRIAKLSMDDGNSYDTCDACGRRFGYGRGKLINDKVVHDFDCMRPGVW